MMKTQSKDKHRPDARARWLVLLCSTFVAVAMAVRCAPAGWAQNNSFHSAPASSIPPQGPLAQSHKLELADKDTANSDDKSASTSSKSDSSAAAGAGSTDATPAQQAQLDEYTQLATDFWTSSKYEHNRTMFMLALALGGVGLIGATVGQIWLMVVAFKKSVLWGLAVMFLPFAGLVFIVLNWTPSKVPLAISVVGVVVICAGLWGAVSSIPAGMLQPVSTNNSK